jgi:TRAP transporter TAXI family solute receptor
MSIRKSKTRALMIFLFLTFSFFCWASAGAQTKTVRLSIATGGTGGVYYVMGGGIAALISKYMPQTEATAEVTAAAVDNLKLIMTQKADIAFSTADVAYDGYRGLERFKPTGKIPIRALAMIYPSVSHIVTIEGTGINTAADLKGKRVSTGAPGSGVEVTALKILDALKIDPNKGIRRERLGFTESVGAVKDRKLDAFFAGPGIPAAAIMDLASTPGTKIRLVAHEDLLETINQKFGPTYFRFVIPKETYTGMTQPVPVIATGNILVVHETMDEKVAYGVVKTIFDRREDLIAVHKEAEKITLATAGNESGIPFHPGAIKYYREKKAWQEK